MMSIDLFSIINDDTILSTLINNPNIDQTTTMMQNTINNRSPRLATTDLIEFLKSTKSKSHRQESKSRSNKNHHRFSLDLDSIHPFDFRKFLRSLSFPVTSTNVDSHHSEEKKISTNRKASVQIVKSKLESIEETSNDNCIDTETSKNESKNLEKLEVTDNVSETIQTSDKNTNIVDMTNYTASSSTETLKVDDQFDLGKANRDESPIKTKDNPKSKMEQVQKPFRKNNEDSEEIIETLRQVLRLCTKMDMSKRASAVEVHQILDKLIVLPPQKNLVTTEQLLKPSEDREKQDQTEQPKEEDSKD